MTCTYCNNSSIIVLEIIPKPVVNAVVFLIINLQVCAHICASGIRIMSLPVITSMAFKRKQKLCVYWFYIDYGPFFKMSGIK